MFCIKCGKDILPTTTFCINCGSKNEVTEIADWFYESNGEKSVALSTSSIIEMIKTGKIGYGDLIWRNGFANWVAVELTDFKSHLGPPPILGSRINNTYLWILAFAPIIGTIAEWAVAYTVYPNDALAAVAMRANKFWFITLALNVTLSAIDEHHLKKAGFNTSKFKGWVWLIPVYIFQRTKVLKQGYACFIIWLISFAICLIE